MLSISGLTKAFAGRVLFEDVSLQLNRGDRIGLVGPNGAGKSTLLALILQRERPDAGSIACQRGMSIGYLPQETVSPSEQSVLETATANAGGFNTGNIAPGVTSAPITMNTTGALDYRCTIHPSMVGTLTVTP